MFLFNLFVFFTQNPYDTPWTNASAVGIPGIPVFNGRIPLNPLQSLNVFQSFMNNLQLNYTYDYAVAITK